ncbi:MAG: SAM-dependent chlorinase/fluorinase [Betaproteobacteria bacterium]|nr:SAM-dependent chlorinase/fluorinase [Betaproteobacteria bacterium]
MAIFLFTDFGSADLYVGQVKSVLHAYAPSVAVIDLLHEAPAFNVKAGAHLLAALVDRVPAESVVVAVVDPGVGGARMPVVMRADGRWYVGPDNGLLSVIAARAQAVQIYPITWRPTATLSASFHGRDLFAPFAGMLASGALTAAQMEAQAELDVRFGGDDLPEVIYIDHFGNAMTGLRAGGVNRTQRVVVGDSRLGYARVFSDVEPGAAFWYENSIGLIEIAANAASAAAKFGLKAGQAVSVS